MTWEIEIWTPDRSTVKAAYSNATPGGIADGFTWNVAPNGNCMQFTFKAVPASVDIGPRDLIQLIVDDQPAFYGYITQAWPANDTALREYRAVGAAELLKQRMFVSELDSISKHQISFILTYISENRLPPAIIPSPSYAGDSVSIKIENAFGVSLAKIIDDLSHLVDGVSWGVDASGMFFFDVIDTTETITGDVEITTLPIIGSDVVTAATVMVGAIPVRYEAPEHAVYGAEKSWVYPVISSLRVDGISVRDIDGETSDGGATWKPWGGDLSMLFDGSDQTGLSFGDYGLVQMTFKQPTMIGSVYVNAYAPDSYAVVVWKKADGTIGSFSNQTETLNGYANINDEIVALWIYKQLPITTI